MDDSATLLRPDAGESTALTFEHGRIVGNRYEIKRRLGRGGMGEVWLAFDLRLRVDVALKVLLAHGEGARLLHQEIRASREVISPNVCRVFDLVEADGLELLSMEFVDGITLRQHLAENSPLEFFQAQEIAAQFLAGLEAIHAAGLVHRDLKPENVMMTRTGRVVVMDFGLARPTTDAASVAGTLPYMAPELLLGRPIDRRADIYAAGVLLAEMLHPDGVRSDEARRRVWDGARRNPPQVADAPWAHVLLRALAHDPDARYASSSALARALEDVRRRLGLLEEKSPYPGLASFTEADAENFFGREAEIAQIWKTLADPPRLLGVIGASGAGKSSLLRAGVIPARPAGWRVAIMKPGTRPFAALASVLAPDLAGSVEAFTAIARVDEPDVAIGLLFGWRRHYEGAVLIVDQFEELFTLADTEAQTRFAELVSRLPIESDVHVVLSMRDDFLIRCHDHESLAPVFSEVIPVKAPAGEALRRALVQPALKHGYRFEDEALVEEIVAQVSGERAALPLAAFAVAQLWETRDRQNGILTRRAYEEAGGVGGALAKHAEATLDRIGPEGTPVVREIFRNLVTAHGTRASRDREELLAVWEDRDRAAKVLDALIDARLLTSYEEGQVEIVHESLLSAWPRLVQWQTQDADGALLRDHLRQAAELWEERGREEELLWSGNAYREFAVWRSRYPGALTPAEETFASAMKTNDERHKRRRQLAVGAALLLAFVITAIFGVLWRRSAVETRRAEAQKLLALSQAQLERDPTAALAYARTSLEIIDTAEGRERVMEALWGGPIARIFEAPEGTGPASRTLMGSVGFSPDNNWLTFTSMFGSDVLIPAEGAPARRIPNPPASLGQTVAFTSDSRHLAIQAHGDPSVHVYRVPEMSLARDIPNAGGWFTAGERVVTFVPDAREWTAVRAWPIERGEPDYLGEVAWPSALDRNAAGQEIYFQRKVVEHSISTDGSVIFPDDEGVLQERIGSSTSTSLWQVGTKVSRSMSFEGGATLGVETTQGISIRLPGGATHSITASNVGAGPLAGPHDVRRSRVAFLARDTEGEQIRLANLEEPPSVMPQEIGNRLTNVQAAFDVRGEWLATTGQGKVHFWPVTQPGVRIIPHTIGGNFGRRATFAGSSQLITCGTAGGLRQWAMHPPETLPKTLPFQMCLALSVDARGANAVAGGTAASDSYSDIYLVPLDGAPARKLFACARNGVVAATEFDPSGTRIAASLKEPARQWVALIDIASGKTRTLAVPGPQLSGTSEKVAVRQLVFGADGMLYGAGVGGIRRWNLANGRGEVFRAGVNANIAASADGRILFAALQTGSGAEFVLFDLGKETERRITSHGSVFGSVAIDAKGEIIATGAPSGGGVGALRVGSASGGPAHLFVSETRPPIAQIAISPDSKWIATCTPLDIRLWPMPDLSKPPLHTWPLDQLLAKLDDLTNLRAVPDKGAPNGYKLVVGPFPGWRDVPTWP